MRILMTIFLAIPLCFAWSTVSQAEDCTEGQRLFQQAKEKQKTTPATERVQWLKKAVSLCTDTRIDYELGRTYLEMDQAQEALVAFKQAQAKAGDSTKVQYMILGRMAEAYFKQNPKDIVNALAYSDRAMALAKSVGESPSWLVDLRKTIDKDEARQHITGEQINRGFSTSRALPGPRLAGKDFDPRPKQDLYILFDYDKDQPNSQGQSIDALGQALTAQTKDFDPQARPTPSPSPTPSRSSIQIIGHTDKQGEDKKGSAYNDNLSIRRARSVVGLLVQKYPALQGRLKAEGKGSREPRYQGEGEEIYRLNRRIEVVLPQ